MPNRVLFLCVGNSARSQMAEAIVNHNCPTEWTAFSAGSAPAGFVHPMALRVLSEIGIEHAGRSKSVSEFTGQSFDLVMTVCGEEENNCPVWLGIGQKVHMAFEDPAKFKGSDAEKLQFFRSIRDQMQQKILDSLEKFNGIK
jgi:arsenate reductase (thioredoxin)